MNREPINPDDPQMSAYALGELSVAEAAEFEARLQDSPLARAELASMREIMGLLSMGLREEWKDGASHPKLTLLEPFTTVNSTVVVGESLNCYPGPCVGTGPNNGTNTVAVQAGAFVDGFFVQSTPVSITVNV